MLTELVVQDLGVIEHAEVDLQAGSTALTGETGAGKTLVVAAVGLLLGDRADRSLVRAGAARARVQGRISIPPTHPIRPVLEAHGLLDDDDPEELTIVVSRSIEAEGTSKTRINGNLVTLSVASEICRDLMAIAGQHAHHRIADRAHQGRLFDRLAGDDVVRSADRVGELVKEWRRAERAAVTSLAGRREREREMDALRAEIAEIEGVAPQPGEWAELIATARRLENAEALAGGMTAAAEALRGEGGIEELLLGVEGALEGIVVHDPALEAPLERARALRIEASDIALELRGRVPSVEDSDLEAVRERIDAIARLGRKFGDGDGAILDYLDKAREKLAELEGIHDSGVRYQDAAAELERAATVAASALSAARAAAVERVTSEVERWLARLALDRASFGVELEERELYEGGREQVLFTLSTNPGEPRRPLSKVASGGELARVALALRLSAGVEDGSEVGTMIFDEVDSGVGGEAARSVGRCLTELASAAGIQVIVVTHLPQIAAQADHHLLVSKEIEGSSTRAAVRPLEGDGRVEELSRMLAGMPESELAKDHARELLSEAGAR